MIADFEEGGTAPVIIQQEGRNGEWEMFNDKSQSNQTMAVTASGNSGMCDAYALRVTGSNYNSYAGFGFSLSGPKTAPVVYNAAMRNFTGIRFKAKLGSGADMRSPVRFNISTPWTENSANPGGQCTPRAASGRTRRASSSAQIVMAAGSVMNDPITGPIVRIVTHHAAGVPPPAFAMRRRPASAKPITGRVDASAMMTTTNMGSV